MFRPRVAHKQTVFALIIDTLNRADVPKTFKSDYEWDDDDNPPSEKGRVVAKM